MAYKKIAELVYRLSVLTERKQIQWERTPDDAEFQCSFPGYSIVLAFHYIEPDGFRDPEVPVWVLSIRDRKGTIVESVNDDELREFIPAASRVMRDMWDSARRQALGVEAAVDQLLGYLGGPEQFPPMPAPENLAKNGDDLPF